MNKIKQRRTKSKEKQRGKKDGWMERRKKERMNE